MVRIISALILAVTVACATAAEPLRLVDNPPDRHIVVPGDTLWAISGKFLKEPWRWPEIWRLNKAQIKNPHRIYPGDIILLDVSGGEPRLSIARPLTTDKLQPKIYTDANREIPSIPTSAIEPFISQPLLIDQAADAAAPRIVATQEDRVFLGLGDSGFVAGIPDAAVEKWHVYRPGKPLVDPETQKVIGHEAFFLGNARLVQPGAPATVQITLAREEISRGDRLLPAPAPSIISYVPHRPETEIRGSVMSLYDGLHEGGKFSVVSINRGSAQGLEIGHVLALHRKRVSDGYDDNGRRVSTVIPEERYALAFVFRVFDNVAYALIMESSRSVIVGDPVRNP